MRILVFYPEPETPMNYFDSDMSKSTNKVVYFDWKQTIIHQHVHLWRESQSHIPAHVLIRLYPLDKPHVLFTKRKKDVMLEYLIFIILPSCYIYLLTPFKQNSYQSSRELSWTYQQWAGVITKLSQHLNDNSCEDGKSK